MIWLKKNLWIYLSFNNQIPWNEKLNLENIYKFLNNGNDINILIQDYNFIGWAWQTKSGIIQDYDLTVKLKPHQIYQSKWLVDKKFLYNRQNKNLSLAWIQDLKKFYKKQGFTEGVAYIDSWNRGVLKSCLRSGYKIKNQGWNNDIVFLAYQYVPCMTQKLQRNIGLWKITRPRK